MGFFSDLFGGSQRKDIRNAKRKSDAELQSGYDEAQPYYEQAFDALTPFAQSGVQANTLYTQALGLGTPEERNAAQNIYFSDPGFNRMMEQSSNALLRNLNARGQSVGGKANLAAARVASENYGGWLDRINNLGQQGGQFASGQSSIRMGQGDMRYGLGATRAGQETNYGNAIAQSRTTGINNLLNIAGTAGKAYGAFSDARLKRDVFRIGETPAGVPVYQFKYLWSDQPYIGVMAHEARDVFPEAVTVSKDGYLMVDYSQIG